MVNSTLAERTSLIATAQSLAPLVREYRDEIESSRRLPPALVQAFHEAGLFRMWRPKELGGLETDAETFVRVVEEIACVDGSAGWNLAFGVAGGFFSAFLPRETGRAMYEQDPNALGAGVVVPTGRAVVEGSGFRVTGRWSFASGCHQATWLYGNCLVFDGDTPRIDAAGEQAMRFLWFPVGECEIVDTWHVSGLRGTGSNDFVVTNVFVPEERSFDAYNGQPAWPGALFQFPRPSLLSSCISSVMLGIARGAIETLVQLASVKIPAGSRGLLRERGAVQADIARAEALVQSARAWLFALFAEVAETCATGHAISLQQRARLRLASVNAGQSAAQAVDLICNAGGSSSIFTSSPLERFSRDVRAAAQNIAVTPITYEICGRVLLGMDPGTPRF